MCVKENLQRILYNKNMSDKIYIIGHKSPDTDSVVAAISYANLKNKIEETDVYTPAVAGDINKATEFALNKFGIEKPELVKNAKGKKIILVDHNEASQVVDGVEEGEIVEILDHHKMNFNYSSPIKITVKPLGSTCSIITQFYEENNIEIEKRLAGLMLSAVLDDTVITKSPTCTEIDKQVIERLSQVAGIEDWKSYGLELFKAKASIGELSDIEIIKNDYKDFEFKAGKFGIGQVETVDLKELESRENGLLAEMEKMRETAGYHSVVLFLTDIINEGSKFLIATSDSEKMEAALGTKLEDKKVYIKDILSRKKQVVPMMSEVFDK